MVAVGEVGTSAEEKSFGDKAHELNLQLLLSAQLNTVAGLSIDSDLNRKLG